MNKFQRAYADISVALARLARQADRAQIEEQRWRERVALAERLGKHDLAEQARERVLRAAEEEIHLRTYIAGQQAKLDRVRELSR